MKTSPCRFALIVGVLVPFGPGVAAAADSDANLAWFRDLAETRSYTLGLAALPKLTPDGRFVFFLRAGAREPVLRLCEFDVATGQERELLTPQQLLGAAEERLSPEEKARRERQRQSLRGFTSFELSEDGGRSVAELLPSKGKP